MTFLFQKVNRIHCVGIKGIGVSSLAQILAVQGYNVTGSDVADPFPADRALKRAGIRIFKGFATKHVPKSCELVIASNAYLPPKAVNPKSEARNPKQYQNAKSKNSKLKKFEFVSRFDIRDSNLNPEIREAIRRGIPIRSYPDVVAELFNDAYGIAVAGTHGKSTASALLAVTLEALGYDPTAVIGAVVNNWHSNAHIAKNSKSEIRNPKQYQNLNFGNSKLGEFKFVSRFDIRNSNFFVLEADEYKNAFLQYRPKLAVVTSVDWDHPDIFPTSASYHKAFNTFVHSLEKNTPLILFGDAANTRKLRTKTRTRRIITYGEKVGNTLRIKNIRQTPQGIEFTAIYRGRSLGTFRVHLFGRHNALNTAAVIAACLSLGEKPTSIRKALLTFKGTRRRFEILTPRLRQGYGGQAKAISYKPYAIGPIIIDDYAHHPEELRATIATAKEVFPHRRIRVLFQPHTYSRTKVFFNDFVHVLQAADDVAILKTYGSAREKRGSLRSRSETLAKTLSVPHFANHTQALKYYQRTIQKKDVLLVLGAGDGDQFAQKLIKLLRLHKR